MALRGSIRWARVSSVYTQTGGYPVCDVVDRYGGVYTGVRFLCQGGGLGNYVSAGPRNPLPGEVGPTGAAVDPLLPAAEVALIFPEAGGHPWVLASAMHSLDAAVVVDVPVPPLPAMDYVTHYVTDAVIQRTTAVGLSARVVVSELAGVVLQGLAGQPIRLQVTTPDQVRISSDGEAGESVLLGGVTRAYLDGLVAQVEALRLAIVALETWGQRGTAANGSIPAYVPVEGASAPVVPYSATSVALESGTIALSSKPKVV